MKRTLVWVTIGLLAISKVVMGGELDATVPVDTVDVGGLRSDNQTNQLAGPKPENLELLSQPFSKAIPAPFTFAKPPAVAIHEAGATGLNGSLTVQFDGNLNRTYAVQIKIPGERIIQGQIRALAISDNSGNRSWLGFVRDCQGVIAASSQVVYAKAFDKIDADVVFVYGNSFFEQYVVLRQDITLPDGIDETTAKIEAWTEFFQCPEPKLRKISKTDDLNKSAAGALADLDDYNIDFDTATIIQGRAFSLPQEDGKPFTAAVKKQWKNKDGRVFLIESVDWKTAKTALEGLAKRTAQSSPQKINHTGAEELPPIAPDVQTGKPLQLAEATTAWNETPGLVLDYLLANSALLNVSFGVPTNKVGAAAVSRQTNDFWNIYTGPWVSLKTITNLLWSTQFPATSSVSMTVSNAPGQWGNNTGDPMYDGYIYPQNWGNIQVTVSNLPAGLYDFYLYGHGGADAQNSRFQLWWYNSTSNAYVCAGEKCTATGSQWWNQSITNWWNTNTLGQGYFSLYQSILVDSNHPVQIIVLPDSAGYSIINGLQIVASVDADGDGLLDWYESQIGTNPYDPDTDYDGRSDYEELRESTSPVNSNSFTTNRLGYFRFDTSNWMGERGQLPTYASAQSAPSWSTNAVNLPYNGSVLQYRDVELDGRANINCRNGSIRFWFKPNWSSVPLGGTGPQTYGRLLEVGEAIGDWWELGLNPSGTMLSLNVRSNTYAVTPLAVPIQWTANQWHQIAVTYRSNLTSLYIDGACVTNGSGLAFWPTLQARSLGISMGNDHDTLTQAAKGCFEELETFNYLLSSAEINANYQAVTNTANFSLYNGGIPILLLLPTNNLVYVRGSLPTLLATNSTLVCTNDSLSGGRLTVAFSGQSDAEDRWTLSHQGTGAGQIGISGTNVSYGGTTIGDFSGGVGTAPLVVRFNASATVAAGQAVIRRICYQSVAANPASSTRAVNIAIADGHGGVGHGCKNVQIACPVSLDAMLVIDRSYSMAPFLARRSLRPTRCSCTSVVPVGAARHAKCRYISLNKEAVSPRRRNKRPTGTDEQLTPKHRRTPARTRDHGTGVHRPNVSQRLRAQAHQRGGRGRFLSRLPGAPVCLNQGRRRHDRPVCHRHWGFPATQGHPAGALPKRPAQG